VRRGYSALCGLVGRETAGFVTTTETERGQDMPRRVCVSSKEVAGDSLRGGVWNVACGMHCNVRLSHFPAFELRGAPVELSFDPKYRRAGLELGHVLTGDVAALKRKVAQARHGGHILQTGPGQLGHAIEG
jgi:hypothetical protein